MENKSFQKISEERKLEILKKLKEEREIRKNLVKDGKQETFLVENIINMPIINYIEEKENIFTFNNENVNTNEELKQNFKKNEELINKNQEKIMKKDESECKNTKNKKEKRKQKVIINRDYSKWIEKRKPHKVNKNI